MKPFPLVLVPLTLLLGACSSFRSPPPVAKRTVPPAVRAENKITAFGEFPSYDPQGQYFKLLIGIREYEAGLSGRAVVDVIVNADGNVQDAAIFESSGDPEVDKMALRVYKNSRYSLRLSPGDPAPYVVRQEFAPRGWGVADASRTSSPYKLEGGGPPPNDQHGGPGNYSYSSSDTGGSSSSGSGGSSSSGGSSTSSGGSNLPSTP